jgi:hypothetical protein
MHSNTLMVKPIPLPTTFQERLDSFNNPSLWENLSYDSDGEWIHEGLLHGLLCIARDGSFMAEESTLCRSDNLLQELKTVAQVIHPLILGGGKQLLRGASGGSHCSANSPGIFTQPNWALTCYHPILQQPWSSLTQQQSLHCTSREAKTGGPHTPHQTAECIK